MPVHSNSRSCRLGRRPVTQGQRNQSSNQGWTEKLDSERKIRASKDILSVGTWNVRTLWAAGKQLFGHICRMENDRKIKSIVFGRLDGTNKRGRPHTEWMDNITDWCGASIQELYHAALEKQKWRRITRTASGTYGH